MKRITIKDIAREAGVTDATVSLSFKPDSRISDQTRQKVLQVAKRFNYVPNLAARYLRNGHSNTVGILVTEVTNPWNAFLIRHTQEVVYQRGYQLFIAESQWSATKELSAIEAMAQLRVRGVLFCCSEKTDQSFKRLKTFALPYVLLDTSPQRYRGSFVGNDLVAAGQMAANHLLDAGCRYPAHLTGSLQDLKFSSFRKLKKGFTHALKARGVGWDESLCVAAGLTIDEGREGMRALLARAPQIDGVFCVNDLCAMGAMEAVEEIGRRTGRDLAVVGVDDIAVSSHSRISLTTLRFPHARIASLAANALLDLLERKRKEPINESIEPELIIRKSSHLARKRGAPESGTIGAE
ncbi:MAG: hypothetical protein A2064_13195 [Spirochaetes bacterium GWB1_66_5]|nr:MAG: hypothetical protein A2064_13195 [Spirochaetes bacterium GWB1_66_5]